MDKSTFEEQIKRLESQWPNSYKNERMALLWNMFKDVSNFDFRDAITYLLISSRSAPLVDEINKAVERSRANYFQKKRQEESSALGLMNNLALNNTTANKEFVSHCVKLFEDLCAKKITKQQFDEGIGLLMQAAKVLKKPTTTLPDKYLKPLFDDDKPF